MEQSVIDRLKQEHGELRLIERDDGVEFIVRCPTRPQYQVFLSHAFDEARRAKASSDLVRACVVHPSLDEYDRIVAKNPATPELLLIEHVLELAKGTEQVRVKKL